MTNTKTATNTKITDRELAETELDHVVGGNAAKTSGKPNPNSISFSHYYDLASPSIL